MGNNKNLFFGGIPTEPDVKKLMREIPNDTIIPGMNIPYSEVEKIIGSEYRTFRFASVTHQWKKKVELDTGNIIVSRDGTHFKVLTDSEKVAESTKKLRSAVKSSIRALVITKRVDIKKISEAEKQTLLFNQKASAGVQSIKQLRQKGLEAPEM